MRVEAIKGFLDGERQNQLNLFVTENISLFTNGRDSGPINKPGAHLVSRFSDIVFPGFVFELYDELGGLVGLTKENRCKVSPIVVNYTKEGGALIRHKDISHVEGKSLLRCNIITSAPDEGGVLFVEGQPVELEAGDLYFCLVSEHYHWATPVVGNTPRVVWQFGYSVDKERWDNGSIKLNRLTKESLV